jgi:hypothetical protein|tara:strand:- start:122 stop:478 length:357 start_codon:yes stop_codon:yes gene_type:complete
MKHSIKTIDISALEYFDRLNGNRYFAGKVILNYGYADQITLPIEYQYGYGNQYEYTAFEEIKKHYKKYNNIVIAYELSALHQFCNAFDIILRSNKRNAKKSELKDLEKSFKYWEPCDN